jgi:tetratricopeptide (TPR) repeat protein
LGIALNVQKLEEALKAYQQTLEIIKKLAEQDPSNAGWQHDLAVGYNKVGDVLSSQGKLKEAFKAYQQSLEMIEKLAEQDHSNAGWQRDLAAGYSRVGDVLSSQG